MAYDYGPPNLASGRYDRRIDLPTKPPWPYDPHPPGPDPVVSVPATLTIDARVITKIVWTWGQAVITNDGPSECWWQVPGCNISALPPGNTTVITGRHVLCWSGDPTTIAVTGGDE
jgi:hypothetical protein